MKLQYAVLASAASLALLVNAAVPDLDNDGHISKEEFNADRAARLAARAAKKAKTEEIKAAAKEAKAASMADRQAAIDAKQAERDAKSQEQKDRIDAIIQAMKEKKNYHEAKELQKQQKENYALQKELDLAAKLLAHEEKREQWLDRQDLKELRAEQKEAWKDLNEQQKLNFAALDPVEKANWETNRAAEISTFNTNMDDWETEDDRQKAVWNEIMELQQVHWAAKVSGLYEAGTSCIMPGDDWNPLYLAGDYDYGIDLSSYDEAQTRVGSVSFSRADNGGFYLLVSTDRSNSLYLVSTSTFAGQEGNSDSAGYSEHPKAMNMHKAQIATDTDGSYAIKMVSIADVDGDQFTWALCENDAPEEPPL